jgi:hypothetical protein
LIKDQWRSGLEPEAAASAELTVDFDAEMTTCPACMTSFKPDVPMCPGCGLRFG